MNNLQHNFLTFMITIEFVKMNGLGNDFVIIDNRNQHHIFNHQQLINIANRHTGVGCDQVIILNPSKIADCFMLIYNQDASEALSCGNAFRCVGQLLATNNKQEILIQTKLTIIKAMILKESILINMNKAKFNWYEIPQAQEKINLPIKFDYLFEPKTVNIGNPHIVFFVDDLLTIDLATIGPQIETNDNFPDRINVNIAQILSKDEVKLIVWERGVGLTKACGTGACATFAVAKSLGLINNKLKVYLPGGELLVSQNKQQELLLSGKVEINFTGKMELKIK